MSTSEDPLPRFVVTPSDGSYGRIAVTEISRDAARRTGRPGPGATAEGGRRARYRYVAAVNAKSVELQ